MMRVRAEGAPVVVGPAGGDPGPAVAELGRLLADGPTAAGAGVELCPGFVSARLDGARGDRRDAVLAAVRVLGLEGLHRLGERAGVLVALFGAEATKPVAAAAGQAIADGRWAALQLASAASGVLGAEQLERVLRLGLPAPTREGDAAPTPARPLTDPAPGGAAAEATPGPAVIEPAPEPAIVEPGLEAAASTMAGHLERVLSPFPRRRRLDLLLDLWERVAAERERVGRRRRLRAMQGRQSRLEELTARYEAHEEELLIAHITQQLGHEPSLAEAARWFPEPWERAALMRRVVADALAATVLVRTAVAVADHGVREGIARCADQLVAAAALMKPDEAGRAARRVPRLTGLPARPGNYVRDLAAKRHDPREPYVRQRLARAAEYAEVVIEAVTDRVLEARPQPGAWAGAGMREWRAVAGYTPQRDPASWSQPHQEESRASLSERLAARPGTAPEEEETAGDLLWYAELADALAQLNGHERADIDFGPAYPYLNWNPFPRPEEQLTPPVESIPAALAGAAQLISFGGRPPRQCRTWEELVTGLIADLRFTEAFTRDFSLPEPLAARDGTILPGTRLRVECARNARMLTRWSAYMGNCIGSPHYAEAAAQGRCVLLALRREDGAIAANVELVQHTRGWRIEEFRARFNADPDPALRQRVLTWVAGLPVPAPAAPEPPDLLPGPRPASRRRPRRASLEVSGPLAELVADALTVPDVVAALNTFDRLYAARDGAPTSSTAPEYRASGSAVPRSRTPAGAAPSAAVPGWRTPAGDAASGFRAAWDDGPGYPEPASAATGPQASTVAMPEHQAPTDVAPEHQAPTSAAPAYRAPTGPASGSRVPTGAVPGPQTPTNAVPGARTPTGAAPGARGAPAIQMPAGLTALRRLPAERIERACRYGLAAAGLVALWRATGVRPLERALAALDPRLREQYDQLPLLLADAPLPGSLRRLARHEAIAPARSMELVARRIRAALGRLARAGDPVLADHVARRADTALLCALVVAVTSWPGAGLPTVPVTRPGETGVPGFPRTDLDDPDGPWRRAFPAAVELGADLAVFSERVATDGLQIPSAWLGHGGWPALWQRAAR
ncbi:hypothetical protein ACIBI7_29795 [Nonomuraea fuscirosea]|uniref:hypothetical protein n=1 Tax=Nonomuraea fuscirosea TaxID=1291556 RepID=UPI0037B6DBAB